MSVARKKETAGTPDLTAIFSEKAAQTASNISQSVSMLKEIIAHPEKIADMLQKVFDEFQNGGDIKKVEQIFKDGLQGLSAPVIASSAPVTAPAPQV